MLLSLALLLVARTSPLCAQVSSVPPFIGTYSETWEEFGVSELPSGTPILGGIATISGDHIVTDTSFQMCSVRGRPSDGILFMNSDRPSGPLTISFSQPVSAFGAYWGSGVGCLRCCGYRDAPSNLTFKDVNGNVVGADSFSYRGDGALMWHGYRFSTPVKTIVRVAGDDTEGVAIDGLQATVAAAGASSAQFQNISTRLPAGTGDNVPIAGFIVAGSDGKKVLVRALGPSLPVSGTLADPVLELHDSTGAIIATNDNWKDTQQGDIQGTGIPPANDLESAIVRTLPANNSAYTAVVRGKGGGTGIALVEVYDVDASATSQLVNTARGGWLTPETT